MKKILVTGATGAIGSLVIKYLLSEGKYEITAIDLRNKRSFTNLKKYRRRINIIYGDICDPILVDALVKDHDYIIHLAGIMPPLANAKKELPQLIDYKGTENIIRAIDFYNKKCELIYASTTTIYKPTDKPVSISSKIEIDEYDYYSKTKLEIEKIIEKNLKNYIIFRLPLVLANLHSFKIPFNGLKNEIIEIISAEDAAYAFVKAIENVEQLNSKKFNLTGGKSCQIKYQDLLSNILKYYGLSWIYIFSRIFDDKNYHGFTYKDSDKLDDILHFRNDSISSYFMRLKRNNKNRRISILLAKPILLLLNKKKVQK